MLKLALLIRFGARLARTYPAGEGKGAAPIVGGRHTTCFASLDVPIAAVQLDQRTLSSAAASHLPVEFAFCRRTVLFTLVRIKMQNFAKKCGRWSVSLEKVAKKQISLIKNDKRSLLFNKKVL